MLLHPPAAVGKTTRLIMTTRLRATLWLRQFDPMMVLAVALLLGGALGGLALERAGRAVRERQIVILVATTTPMPTAALPTVRPTIAPVPTAAPVEALHIDAAPVPTIAPAGSYVAHTTEGDIVIPPDATPVPTGATTYTGPFLAPAATEAPRGPRLCTGYGDWRDYDPMYAASPACQGGH